MNFGLVCADGPTPRKPRDARTLGWESGKVAERMSAERGAFALYVHAVSVPELVALVRAFGRDCTFTAFAERQALLLVTERRSEAP